MLELPAETQTLGPQQVQAQFLGSPEVSSQLNLLRQNQTTIEYGNLLTLPVAGGLLYVEPVYIERAGQSASYPVLARVLVSYNGRVGYDASLARRAGRRVRPGCGQRRRPAGAAAAGSAGAPGAAVAAPNPANADQAAAAAAIQQAIGQLKAAQQSGDFAAQGQALSALDQAVQRYQQVATAAPAPAPVPAATGGG